MDLQLETKIEQARLDIEMANNGYSDIGVDAKVASALSAMGYVVIASSDLHGHKVFRGFKKSAQQALKASCFSASTYAEPSKSVKPTVGVCTEELLLAQAEELLLHE